MADTLSSAVAAAPAADLPPACRPLTFDVVIATRNRPEALVLSIPLILGQSRQPEKLIVIDSSDDHGPVAETVARVTDGWEGEVIVEHSAPGLPLQRNRGLSLVTADVVLFPDDDSLLYPGTAEAIMKAYEADTDGSVVAVCTREAFAPPPGVEIGQEYTMSAHHRREAKTRLLRNRIERRLSSLKPSLYLGTLFMNSRAAPEWLAGENCRKVEFMSGFRMSFRTCAIKAEGFDENLRNYALDEDIDASLTMARQGHVIAALDGNIYHHRFPGGRGNGFTLGAIAVLNRVYILRKHLEDDRLSPAERRGGMRRLRGFIQLKLLAALPGLRSAFGREKFRGAWAGARAARQLLDLPADKIGPGYRAALDRLGV